jgi:CheY-like chemotaxis protein
LAQEKILIIDDNPIAVEVIDEILSPEGFKILKAYDGAEGIRIATEEHPDLILLDLMMPAINGYEVLAKIKKIQIPTRVIISSAYLGSLHDIVKLIKTGACDCLSKPFSKEELINVTKRSLVLDGTIGNDTSQFVETLIAKAMKLEHDNKELLDQNRYLQKKHLWTNVNIRLIYLVVAVFVTIVIYYLRIVTNSQSLFFLPIILFILLLFPIERIKKLYTKIRKAETMVEISSK